MSRKAAKAQSFNLNLCALAALRDSFILYEYFKLIILSVQFVLHRFLQNHRKSYKCLKMQSERNIVFFNVGYFAVEIN